MKATKIIFLLIGIIITSVTIVWYLGTTGLLSLLTENFNTDMAEMSSADAVFAQADNARTSGDPERVVQTLAPLVEGGNDRERGTAVRLSAESLYRNNDVRSQAEAVSLLKTHVADEIVSPEERARSADLLFGFYYSERSPELFQQIFTEGPFDSLDDSNVSEKDMLRAASETVWDIYPTPFTAFRLALWYGSELIENETLTDEERKEYSEELEKWLNDGKLLFDERPPESSSFDIVQANMLNWQALLEGMLATENPEYLGTFEETFNEIRSEIAAQPDNKILLRPYFSSLFYHAALLETIHGQSREDDTRALLNELIEHELMAPVTSDTENVGSFVRLMRNISENNQNDYLYMFFHDLAERSPEFKEFLSRNGFSF